MIRRLRIYDGQPVKQPTKRKTKRRKGLRHVWETIVKPQLIEEGKKPATIREYITHINGWERYWRELAESKEPSVASTEGCFSPRFSEKLNRRPDPPYNRIKRQHLLAFRTWLIPGREMKTVNNYLESIHTLTEAAAESWPRAFTSPPAKIKALKCRKAKPKVYMLVEHVDAIYRACSTAVWPRDSRLPEGITAADYWRAAVVLFFNFGFRTQELISHGSEFSALTWGQIYSQAESPGYSNGNNDHGWLVYTPRKQEAVKPEPLVLALHPIVAMHLRSLRPAAPAANTPIFPFPKSNNQFRDQWHAITRASRVKPKGTLEVNRYQVFHFRKTCITLHNYHRPGIAPFITGHADRDGQKGVAIQGKHYDCAELAAAEALLAFPQPPSFESIRRTDQLTLF